MNQPTIILKLPFLYPLPSHPHPVQDYKEEFLARRVTFSSSNFGRIKGLVGREDEEGLVEN